MGWHSCEESGSFKMTLNLLWSLSFLFHERFIFLIDQKKTTFYKAFS